MRDSKLKDSHYIKFFIVLGVNIAMTYVCVHGTTWLCVLENLSLMSGVFPQGRCKPFWYRVSHSSHGVCLLKAPYLSALDLPGLMMQICDVILNLYMSVGNQNSDLHVCSAVLCPESLFNPLYSIFKLKLFKMPKHNFTVSCYKFYISCCTKLTSIPCN